MPTYINRKKGIVIPLKSLPIQPNNPTELYNYISPHEHPDIEKISDSPSIDNDFQPIFTDVNSITNLSEILTFTRALLFKVEDGSSPCSNNNTVEITLFGGDTDTQSDWQYISSYLFTRKQYTDYDGNSINLWNTIVYPNDVDIIRHPFRFGL